MLKYVETEVSLGEVPEEIALCINISNCPIHCEGCHSPHLWEDIGEELTTQKLEQLIKDNKGITCIAFMGGDSDPKSILNLAIWVKHNTHLKVCWYSGRRLSYTITYQYFDYVKTGPYNKYRGGLDNPDTNQRFYKVSVEKEGDLKYTAFKDVTYKFRKKNETNNKSKSVD